MKHQSSGMDRSAVCAGAGMVAFAMTLLAYGARVDAVDAPDTSRWSCRFCPFPEAGTDFRIEAGILGASDSDFRFADYRGIDHAGALAVGDFQFLHRAEDESWWRMRGHDLGFASRSADVLIVAPGRYRLSVDYDALPRRYGEVQTPFVGAANDWTLPAGWSQAASTSGMSDLAASERSVDLRQARERIGLGGMLQFTSRWSFDAHIHRDTRRGTRAMAGSFLTQSSILPLSVDDRTDRLDASAGYRGDSLRAEFAYYLSQYRNDSSALRWDNPYTPIAAGADRGQLALAPDNEFQQLSVALGYYAIPRMPVSAHLTIGRMTQDAPFLAPTINPNLIVALPRASLDGKVNTLSGQLRVPYALTPKVRLTAEYRYDNHDNRTPRDAYTQVATDVAMGAVRSNVPYSFRNQLLKFTANTRLSSRLNLVAGVDEQWRYRSFQEVSRTQDSTGWLKLRLRPVMATQLSMDVSHSRRNAGSVQSVAQVMPPENTAHRAYYLSDRRRNEARLRVSTALRDWSGGMSAGLTDDRYPQDQVGLVSRRSLRLSFDGAVNPAENWSLHGALARQFLQQTQTGSEQFGSPDWRARSRDIGNTIEVGATRREVVKQIDLEANYVYAASRGDIGVEAASGDSKFPALFTRLDSFELRTVIHPKSDIWSTLGYRFERFAVRDWQTADIDPATLPTVLAIGAGSPAYRVHLFQLSVGASF